MEIATGSTLLQWLSYRAVCGRMRNKKCLKYFLREFFELKCDDRGCQDLLTEGEKKRVSEGHLIFPAKLQEAGTKNGNGRVYTEEVLRREIANYQKLVEDKRSLGECDHPDGEVISLQNASHMVTRIWWGRQQCYWNHSGFTNSRRGHLKRII